MTPDEVRRIEAQLRAKGVVAKAKTTKKAKKKKESGNAEG